MFVGLGTVLTTYLNSTLQLGTAITALSSVATTVFSGGMASNLVPTVPAPVVGMTVYPSWTTDVPPGMVEAVRLVSAGCIVRNISAIVNQAGASYHVDTPIDTNTTLSLAYVGGNGVTNYPGYVRRDTNIGMDVMLRYLPRDA